MYYNANQNSNDYYSAYKEEMGNTSKHQESSILARILKYGLIILGLGVLALATLYSFNYFSTKIKENGSIVTPSPLAKTTAEDLKENKNPTVKLAEHTLPKNIQLKEPTTQVIAQNKQTSNESSINETVSNVTGSTNINPKDIELIVKIIMNQMNNAPKEKAVSETISLEEQLVAAEEKVREKQTLKESNHYNKVVLSSNETPTDTSNELMQLQNSLNDALEENSEKSENSDYSKAISKEVDVRSNEMRVIVVQKGDTLSKIAKKAYGNYDDYIKIFKANPEIVKNPDEIFVGQRLRIPSNSDS